MMPRFLAGFFLLTFGLAQAAAPEKKLTKNLVTDYGADKSDISDLLQKAVDDLGSAGGGTIVIPGRAGNWLLSRPVLVRHPNVTIAGEGGGTRLSGTDVLLVLGLPTGKGAPITPGHRPALDLFDGSVKEPRFGLRSTDGKTPAAGYFQDLPLAYANKVGRDPSGDYWKDYERGTGKPTYWANHPRYTINLAVRNNGSSLMKGAICGVGPGGLTPQTTHGGIADPLDIWTVESDPATGKDLAFRFRVIDAAGKESIRVLPLAPEGAGPGVHRISVQLDFTTGKCRSWYSRSDTQVQQPVLAGRLDLPSGCRFAAFEYGAFRLGRIVASPYAGSPAKGDEGDWTYCGLGLFDGPRFDLSGDRDRLGSAQATLDGKAATDAYRLFTSGKERGLLACLPLTAPAPDNLVPVQLGEEFSERLGYGFWLPSREPELLGGTITVRDLQMFGGIAVGLAEHVCIENVYQGGGGYYHGIGTMNGHAGLLEIHNCRLIGQDAAIYSHGRTVRATNVTGGGGELLFRLVGGQGAIDHVIITGFISADYYVKLHAGAVGGEWRFSEFCSDNEGCSFVPRKACFYAEPSLDGGKQGNRLTLRGSLYSGFMPTKSAVLDLADAPGVAAAKTSATVEIDGIDLWTGKEKLDSVIRCTPAWSGRLLAQEMWSEHTEHGLVHYLGAGACRLTTLQESDALPHAGAWLANCNLVRIPDHQDPKSGTWSFKTFRCVRSGTYGTTTEPQWQEIK